MIDFPVVFFPEGVIAPPLEPDHPTWALIHPWQLNTSEAAMGLYDGHGRLVKPLDALREVFRGKTRMTVGAFALERTPGGRHWLALSEKGRLRLFRPEDETANRRKT